jgi:hypothetical protein
MEKDEYYVEFADETPANYGRGTTPGICYLAYSKAGYYLTPRRQDFQYFASDENAKEACLHLVKDSGGLKGPFSAVTVRKGESTVCHVNKFRALPDGASCPTPQALAAARKPCAVAHNRPADFTSHEKEHENMKLPEMEQSLIAEFKARCEMGFKQYGPVYLAKRNWGKEMKEEALDGLFYALMAAKTVEKYGAFIQALEEASDDDLSMDACSPDPLKQAAYLLKQATENLSATEKDFAQANGMFKHLDKTVVPALRAEVTQLRKALEDEREAKRIAVRNADEKVSRLANDNAALKAECWEARKSGAAELRRAQKAGDEAEALRVELSAALLRCSALEAAAARWKEDADRYFAESDERGRILKEVTLDRNCYKDSAQCFQEALADAVKEKDRLRNELNQLRASAILNAPLMGRPR